MSYSDRLHAWVIVRILPNMQRQVVGRFRKWVDADGHVRVLRQLEPGTEFLLVWEQADGPEAL